MNSNEKIQVVGTNIGEKANLIWNVANSLFGAYKPHEYGLVILPMVVIKRFHDCLLPTQDKVWETYEKVKPLAVKDGFLRKASGYRFYNTSKYNFEKLKADPENIKTNFEDYINGFSDTKLSAISAKMMLIWIRSVSPQSIWAMFLKTLFSVFQRVTTKKPEHILQAVTSFI